MTTTPYEIQPVNNVAPFTFRGTETQETTLLRLRDHINQNLVPEYRRSVTTLLSEFQKGLDAGAAEIALTETTHAALIADAVEFVETQLDGQTIAEIKTAAVDSAQAAADAASLVGAPAGTAVDVAIKPGGAANASLITVIDGKLPTIDVRRFGAKCDGVTNDYDALTAAITAGVAAGIPVMLPQGATIIVGPNPLDLVAGTHLIANGATLKGGMATGNFLVTIRSNVRVEGRLKVVADNTTSNNVRGVRVTGATNVNIDGLHVAAVNVAAGAADPYDSGFDITGSSFVRVHHLTVDNFDYSVNVTTSSYVTFERADINNYVRGIYVNNVIDMEVNGGEMKGLSPNALYLPGHNGVLIGGDEHRSVARLRFRNMVVRNAGEHGFRIGGNKKVVDVRFIDCTVIECGGSGFKTLGGTQTDNNFHEDIQHIDCTVEDAGQVENVSAGVMVQFAIKVKIVNLLVMKRLKPYSTAYGIELQAVEGVSIVNPQIRDTLNAGIKCGFVLGDLTNIVVNGGYITAQQGNGVMVDYTNRVLRRFKMTNRPEINLGGVGYSFTATAGASGTTVGASLVEWFSTTPAAQQVDPAAITAGFYADIVSPFASATHTPMFKNGSKWLDTSVGAFRIKTAGAWS